ncbi:MAG: L,D-transpeptidase [Anaerolineae bacterium]|nr:L,D-transpeptidase [Anaerolineae bacterium]
MSKRWSRREFLRLSGAALTAACLPNLPEFHGRAVSPPARPRSDEPPLRMGRAIHSVAIYDAVTRSAERLGVYYAQETFEISQEIRAPGLNSYNDLWYQTPDGFVFSAWVQPLWVWPPQLTHVDVGEWGFWGEICVAYTDARSEPRPNAASPYRFYNGNVYHVVGVTFDEFDHGWYKVFDELPPTGHQWVRASDVRRIPRAELAPIRPFAGAKRIEVDLGQQLVQCFEGDQLVFSTRCASGIGLRELEDGTIVDLATPEGEQCVLLKQPSRHMSNRPQEEGETPPADLFDLPGVPWNTFFDLSGTAIHGTYWHNDFGVPRSHGCLNVPTDAARWIYLWTYPIGGAEDDYVQSDRRVGTPINIF